MQQSRAVPEWWPSAWKIASRRQNTSVQSAGRHRGGGGGRDQRRRKNAANAPQPNPDLWRGREAQSKQVRREERLQKACFQAWLTSPGGGDKSLHQEDTSALARIQKFYIFRRSACALYTALQ